MSTNFLFPVKSNSRGENVITLDDFKSLVKKPEPKKADITFKDGKFTISKEFLKDGGEFTGFTGVLSEETESYKAYLLKSLTEEAYNNTIFLKGENPTPTFSSDSLKFVIEKAGISLESSVYLHFVGSENGWEIYDISNSETVGPIYTENTQEEIKTFDSPSNPFLEVNNGEVQTFDSPAVIAENAVWGGEAEVEELAQVSVEELSFSDEKIEDLL